MGLNTSPREFVALQKSDATFLRSVHAKIEKKLGCRIALGQFVRLAVAALAKQEGITR